MRKISTKTILFVTGFIIIFLLQDFIVNPIIKKKYLNDDISCDNKKHKENQELILTANTIKTTNNGKELKIQIKLTNNSESVKSYSIMSCSYSDNFVLGNSALLISPIECDKNFPARLILNPNQSETYNLTILKIRASKTEDFKIGFKIIKIQDNSNYFDEYEKQIKDPNIKIVWSNPVKIQ